MYFSFYTFPMNKGPMQPVKYYLYSIPNNLFLCDKFIVCRNVWTSVWQKYVAEVQRCYTYALVVPNTKHVFSATLVFLIQLLLHLKLKEMCISRFIYDCLYYHCWYFGFWNNWAFFSPFNYFSNYLLCYSFQGFQEKATNKALHKRELHIARKISLSS